MRLSSPKSLELESSGDVGGHVPHHREEEEGQEMQVSPGLCSLLVPVLSEAHLHLPLPAVMRLFPKIVFCLNL